MQDFLHRVTLSPYFQSFIFDEQTGAGRGGLPKNKMDRIPVALPPLAEQQRIVAKVDELMALCDKLEAAQAERESRRDRLVRASWHGLNQPADDAATFRDHARFTLDSLPRLTTRPEQIAQLRQSILNLAVRGLLIGSSRTTQETAGELGDFVRFLNGYAFKSDWFQSEGVRLCRNVNIGHGDLNWQSENTARISKSRVEEFERFALRTGDIVLSLDRPLISTGLKVAQVRDEDLPCLLLQRVAKAEFQAERLDPKYLLVWFQSSEFMGAIDPGRSKGVPHISTRQVESLPFCPPPLAEQHRIVARVDELMALCDRLESQLTSSQTESRRLLEAVLHESLQQ